MNEYIDWGDVEGLVAFIDNIVPRTIPYWLEWIRRYKSNLVLISFNRPDVQEECIKKLMGKEDPTMIEIFDVPKAWTTDKAVEDLLKTNKAILSNFDLMMTTLNKREGIRTDGGEYLYFYLYSPDKHKNHKITMRFFIFPDVKKLYTNYELNPVEIESMFYIQNVVDLNRGLTKLLGDKYPEERSVNLNKDRSIERACGLCGKQFRTLKCTRCNSVYYCHVLCQKKHWPEHKKSCGQGC